MARPEILIIVHSKLLRVETRKRLGHPLERIVVKHRCKAEGPEVLIENLLTGVSTGRYDNVLSESSIAWMIHLDGYSLRLTIIDLLALIHLLHSLVKRRAFPEEFVHKIAKARERISWSHLLHPWHRILLLGDLLGLNLRLWLFLLLLGIRSTLGISPRRCVIDIHSI